MNTCRFVTTFFMVTGAPLLYAQPPYPPSPAAPLPLTTIEFFFDNASFTLSTDTLSDGPHQLFVRSSATFFGLTAAAGFNVTTPLPLTWLYIKAEPENDQSHIRWATEQESHTLRFDVEHSIDGISFSTVGRVAAAGDNSGTNAYSWLHTPAPGLNYYRVKEVDVDGKFTYSKIVSLLYRKGLTKTVAIPNPVTNGNLTLILAEAADQCSLNVVNTSGQCVLKMKVPDTTTQQTLDLSPYPSGVYFIQVQHRSGTEMIRVIKK